MERNSWSIDEKTEFILWKLSFIQTKFLVIVHAPWIEFQLNLMEWNGCKLVEMILEIDIDIKRHNSMSLYFEIGKINFELEFGRMKHYRAL